MASACGLAVGSTSQAPTSSRAQLGYLAMPESPAVGWWQLMRCFGCRGVQLTEPPAVGEWRLKGRFRCRAVQLTELPAVGELRSKGCFGANVQRCKGAKMCSWWSPVDGVVAFVRLNRANTCDEEGRAARRPRSRPKKSGNTSRIKLAQGQRMGKVSARARSAQVSHVQGQRTREVSEGT